MKWRGRRRSANVEDIRGAIYAAGLKRIRPCTMTTATTLIALLPGLLLSVLNLGEIGRMADSISAYILGRVPVKQELLEETDLALRLRRINQILAEEPGTRERCARMLYLLLAFSARNPGITRVLMGDALVGETGRLLLRVEQLFARIETQLKQILRESKLRHDLDCRLPAEEAA